MNGKEHNKLGDVNESKSNMTGGLQLAKSYRSSCSSTHIQIRKFITGREDKRFISKSLLQDKPAIAVTKKGRPLNESQQIPHLHHKQKCSVESSSIHHLNRSTDPGT